MREAIRERPELRSTFLSLRAAEELAAKKITNPEDRERFLAMVREAIAASIQRGEPLPDINVETMRRLPRLIRNEIVTSRRVDVLEKVVPDKRHRNLL